MLELDLTDTQKRLCLGAVKAVAMADGEYADFESRMMRAAGRAIGVDDADEIDAASPEAVAASVIDPTTRTRVVQAQLVMALMDGAVRDEELSTVRRFAGALGVDEPRVKNLEQTLTGHLRYLQFDLFRRSEMSKAVFEDTIEKKGWLAFVAEASAMQGWTDGCPETAARYIGLGELPEGTLGRAYFTHLQERGFAFPGEKAGFSGGFAKHDICHVLGDYDTDPTGECEVVAFISGFMKTDPFSYLFMIALHMHLGITIFPQDEHGQLAFDPDRVAAALERGTRVSIDLYDPSIDWFEHFPAPIDELRARWNIGPKTAAG